ncbi:hypothetical protein KM043_018500 [Ampulex compressa]|nr:hypothetical protein KM043_018500 [Ampulex compressa]
MENGQEETKPESKTDATANEVKDEKPASETEDKPVKETPQESSTELLEKIKNQIEFYFGDVNMQRDKFLIEQTKLDEGWVPMTVMLNFKMLAAMSTDVDVILKALESSDLMEVSEDRKKIRRSPKHPLPVYNEEYRKAQEAKTAYVKGFPLTEMTIDKLKTFFTSFEPFENIVMRKYLDKEKKMQFKGSIFVQFKTLDDAKAFMARESVKYADTELIRKWSADYTVEKAKEKEERRQKRSEGKNKKNDNDKEEAESDEEDNEKDSGLPKGSIIHFTGVSETCTREDLKERLGELDALVAFVDFKKGDSEGWVRLQGENAAKAILDKMEDGKVMINETEVTCRILEGEEEEKYLAKAKGEMANTRQKYTKSRRGGRKGRGSQRAGKKRRNSGTHDAVPTKKIGVD